MNLKRLRDEFFPARDPFDSALGVRTTGIVSLSRLRIRSDNKAVGVRYQAVDPEIFRQAIQYVPKDQTFIDLGCGKGRALILAHQAGFRDLIGVDFSRSLAQAARDNLASLGISALVIEQDATLFHFPARACCTFLFNPFGVEVMRQIVPKLRGHIVYVNPQHRAELSGFSLVHEGPSFAIFQTKEG